MFVDENSVEKNVKVSHSLISVGAVGVRVPLSWAQLMKAGARPSLFTALAFPNSKKLHIHSWVDRVFQLSHGEAQPRTHNLTATFCTIIELP